MENQRLNNYYKELPLHFREDYCIDAKKKSVGIALNIIAVLIAVAFAIALSFARGVPSEFGENGNLITDIIGILIVFLGYLVYIVLHELTHGLFYKLLTGQKLRFGLTLTVAFCGLKEGYVNKKTALVAVMAPCVVHSIWMLLAVFLIKDEIIAFSFIILFALHFGGCCGDLWVTGILLFRYRKRQVLMCDDGPKQQFFVYDENMQGSCHIDEMQNADTLFSDAVYKPEEPTEERQEDTKDEFQS